MKLPGEKPLILEKEKGKGYSPYLLFIGKFVLAMKKPPVPEERRLEISMDSWGFRMESRRPCLQSRWIAAGWKAWGEDCSSEGLGLPVVVGTGADCWRGAPPMSEESPQREELDVFSDHAQLGALLAGCLVFPGIQLKTPF